MKFLQKYRWIDLPLNLAVLTLYLLLAKIGLLFAVAQGNVALFWPAGGFALAILLLAGLKYLPGIFAGAFAAGLMAGDSVTISASIAVGNAMESFVAYWLLTHHFNFHRDLATRQDFFTLTLLAGAIAAAVSALICSISLLIGSIIPSNLFPQIILCWWMADMLGIAFMTPLILIWSNPRQQVARKPMVLEVFALFALAFLTGQAIFFDWFKGFIGASPSIAWLIPLIIWSSLRTGRHNAAVLQLMIFIQALWSASHGVGNYAVDRVQSGPVNFWMFGMALAVGGMALAVMSAESNEVESEWHRLYQSISSSINEVYLFRADTMRFFFVNEGARHNLGYSMEEMLSMTPLDLKPIYTGQSFQAQISPLIRHEKPVVTFETVHKRKNGSLYPVEVHLQLNNDNHKQYFQAIILDITERKTAEAVLHENEERYRSLIEMLPDAIVVGSYSGILIANQAALTLWNATKPEDLLGKSPFELVHPDGHDTLRQRMHQVIDHNLPAPLIEEKIICLDGSQKHVTASGTPFNMLGIRCFLVALQDITGRKQAEQREQHHSHVLQMLATKTPLANILDTIARELEAINPPMLCSILLLDEDGKHLRLGAAPSLPEFYKTAIDNHDIGLGMGSCGTAAFIGERVIVENISTHPWCASCSYIAYVSEFNSCWSQPILSGLGKVLGTFVIYHHQASQPTPANLKLIEDEARLTALAIEKTMADSRLQLAANVFSYAREGILITDAAGTIIEINETFTHITGYSREEAVGQNPRILKSSRQPPEFYAAMWQAITEKDHWYGEIWNRRKNGSLYAEMLTISPVRDASGKTQNYVGLFTDITQMKQHQNQLEYLAHYDALTSLPNRTLLADRLQQAINQSGRRNQPLAVAYLDLDGFKPVNDIHGHEVGDELLVAVSQRMKDALREGDTLARIGGDEFVAVLVDLEQMADCELVLARLLKAAADPVPVGKAILQVSASIGVTLYPQDGADADQLMRRADQAMYIAKQSGKNRYHLFDADHDAAVQTQYESVEHIRLALDLDEFVLYYQPKVNMKTGEVIGAEALIRWQHPERGLLSPEEFLPIIEKHPISRELGEWVIDTALTQMSEWHAAGLDIPVSVNVGTRQLQQTDFVARLSALLAAHPDIRPCDLELEMQETSALEDFTQITETMHACRKIGVRFALDDFGNAYSSLTCLRHLPADILKIDQSFVRGMLDELDDMTIVNGIIGLAMAFGRQVIAEGVETIPHGTQLLLMGCTLAQGYCIAQPMPAAELPGWTANWIPDAAWTIWRAS